MVRGRGREKSVALPAAGHFESGGGMHLPCAASSSGGGECGSRTGNFLHMRLAFSSRILARAEADGVTAILSHTRPFSGTGLAYSSTDDDGESGSAGTVRRSLGNVPMGRLPFGREEVIGRAWTADGRLEPVAEGPPSPCAITMSQVRPWPGRLGPRASPIFSLGPAVPLPAPPPRPPPDIPLAFAPARDPGTPPGAALRLRPVDHAAVRAFGLIWRPAVRGFLELASPPNVLSREL